ncbi:30S ribosomal protein S1 [Candidatus Desantisbacteria bacterium]|nr:30S ribosomal protein S1 [Candidatus Desantisbacteria bacterium]
MTIIAKDLIDRVIERTKQEITSHEQHEKAQKQEKITEPQQEQKIEKSKETEKGVAPLAGIAPLSVAEIEKQEEEPETTNQDYEIQGIEEGMLVSGVVEKIDKEEVLVSIPGCKSEGIIPLNELSNRAFSSPEEVVSIGQNIRVYVLEVEGKEGNPILSKRQADIDDAWTEMIKSYETGKILSGKVINTTRGGLIIDIGMPGFVPFSQVDIKRPDNLNSYMGKTLRVRVIELNREGNNLVLSQRQVLEEEYNQKKEMFFDSFVDGMVCDGVVSKITSFGAFIDLGGIDGLVHLSEISWTRIKHPKDVLKQGDNVKVVVLKIDKDSRKVSLSIKQAQVDPWQTAAEKYNIGDVVSGDVVNLARNIAFVRLEDGVEGILPISEISMKRISSPSEVLSEGERVTAKVIDINFPQRRIVLSIKQVLNASAENEVNDFLKSQTKNTGGMTLGDMFKDKFEGLMAK